MTTEHLTVEQRLNILEVGQARLEAGLNANTDKLNDLSVQMNAQNAKLDSIVETQTQIMVILARMDERMNNMEARQDRLEPRQDRLTQWVLGLLTASLLTFAGIAARFLFFPM